MQDNETTHERLLTATELARVLRVSVRKVHDLRKAGLIPSVSVNLIAGKRCHARYRHSDVAAALEGAGEVK